MVIMWLESRSIQTGQTVLCSEADDKPPRTPNSGPGRAGGEENLKKDSRGGNIVVLLKK